MKFNVIIHQSTNLIVKVSVLHHLLMSAGMTQLPSAPGRVTSGLYSE